MGTTPDHAFVSDSVVWICVSLVGVTMSHGLGMEELMNQRLLIASYQMGVYEVLVWVKIS